MSSSQVCATCVLSGLRLTVVAEGGYTKEDKSKQGPTVYLSLQGDAREACREIVGELNSDEGVQRIIESLDAIYLKDETTRAFCALKSFIEFRREGRQAFPKFLLEFNNRYREIKKYKLKLDDGVLAYFLLAAANLSDDHERLVRATSKLEFDGVKDKLQKVFGEFGDGALDGSDTLPVKEESCLYTNAPKSGFGRGQRGNYRGSHYRGGRSRGRNRGNAVDASGTVLGCHCCDSTMHFIADCPHKKVEEGNMTVHITLVAGEMHEGKQSMMVSETVGKGILDSACTKNVAGAVWLEEYLAMLNESDREQVMKSEQQSSSLFRFGDGKESRSKKLVQIPVWIFGEKSLIEVDMVSNDIPLLISKPCMSEMGMSIDFGKNILSVGGKVVPLDVNSAGHYIVSVAELDIEKSNVVFHTVNLEGSSAAEKKRKALKLPRQFAHAPAERLIRLLKSGGCDDVDFIEAVNKCCAECDFCRKYRQPKPKPVVSFPKADRFNDMVAMDLKEVEKGKIWILHMVDCATRYTSACVVYSKKKDVILNKILTIWLAYFGAPRKMHSDCGGEFSNEILRECNDKFGIETSTTPGDAPFANGIVERANPMLFESAMKTMNDVKCSLETAVAWSVSAKNCLQNVYGYSPNQLVFGINFSLPSVASDSLPALESNVKSDLVRLNLNALHSARENFIRAESSERIRRALKHNVRTYAEIEFCPGDKVFYRRRTKKGWQGPAKVLGKDNNFVLIRHGGSFYRCHPCHLIKFVLMVMLTRP